MICFGTGGSQAQCESQQLRTAVILPVRLLWQSWRCLHLVLLCALLFFLPLLLPLPAQALVLNPPVDSSSLTLLSSVPETQHQSTTGTLLSAPEPRANQGMDQVGLQQSQHPQYIQYAQQHSTQQQPVFGHWLFSGEFSRQSQGSFNPQHVIGIGDRIALQLWGGYSYQGVLTVDPQGNIFLPKVGPISLLNVANRQLQPLIERHVKTVYQRNVEVYAVLESAQPIRVFVTGFVNRPGLYAGRSSDPLLYYLDLAAGVNPASGSFIAISLLRGSQEVQQFNLYDFLLRGELPTLQLQDGDTLLIRPRQQSVAVSGLVQNPYQFEFSGPELPLQELLSLARPLPAATHLRISRRQGTVQRQLYLPLGQSAQQPASTSSSTDALRLRDGDQVSFIAEQQPVTVAVTIEGEHLGPQQLVLPRGATLGELRRLLQFSPHSDPAALQLLRDSVRRQQKAMLDSSLQALESSLLTARSHTSDEALLRSQEAKLVLQWVERARTIEPHGQVVLADSAYADAIVLEEGDVIRIPSRSQLVLVHGEVLIPTAAVHEPRRSLQDYLDQAGGLTQSRRESRVLIRARDGSFREPGWLSWSRIYPAAGEEILVLPKVSAKSLQITKDFTQIIYQIAVSAGVVLSL